MPIYAYRCETCGFQQDVLQKMSDARLVDCPACGKPTFQKQVTAAGFQLKGSGWYVTDFRDTGKKEATKGTETSDADTAPPAADAAPATTEAGAKSDTPPAARSDTPPAAQSDVASARKSDAAPAPAPTPAPAKSPPASGSQ